MAKPAKRDKQQTLEATLGLLPVRSSLAKPVMTKGKTGTASKGLASSSPVPPPSSFIHPSQTRSPQLFGSTKKRRIVVDHDSSDESNGEGSVVATPVPKTKGGKKRQTSLLPAKSKGAQENTDNDEEDDWPLVASTARRKRPRPRAFDDSGEEDRPLANANRKRLRERAFDDSSSDSDDQPLASSPIKRRRLVRRGVATGLAKKEVGGEDEDGDAEPTSSVTRARRTGRKPLNDKQKARERLRRRRAGEVIDEEEEFSSSGEEPKKALYDSDSDHPALSEFEDDDEGVLEVKIADGKSKKRSKAKRTKQKAADGDNDSDDSSDNFIVDDSDVPLGVPDHVEVPLELTHHARKPLKEHFRDVIEWLVQFKVNPGFSDKGHALYRMGWQKLDDEVTGLAHSKFISSAWKKDFHMALRARPYFTIEVVDADDLQNCEACGRGGHPSTRNITLAGSPYYKNSADLNRLLEPVETSSTSESSDADAEREEPEDVDENGMRIPNQTKQWRVGMVCGSNAEMGHKLLHWKHDLLEWVDARLHEEGYMEGSKLAERERMTPKKKHKLVDKILADWGETGTIRALYQDFKGMLEDARTRSTTGKYRR